MKTQISKRILGYPKFDHRIFVPLLFKDEMVLTIDRDHDPKTQTRRIITSNNSLCTSAFNELDFNDIVFDGKNSGYRYLKVARPIDNTRHRVFSKITVFDILWVRQAFCPIPKNVTTEGSHYLYRTDTDIPYGKWKPNMFMPFDACRSFLEVIKVFPQYLTDISDGDALKEGITGFTKDNKLFKYGLDGWIWQTGNDIKRPSMQKTPKEAYKMLWEHINGPGSWAKNPLVWVYEFNRIKINK